MFGDPKALIPQSLRLDGEHCGLSESLCGRGASSDGREVEYGEGDHDRIYLTGGNSELAPSNEERGVERIQSLIVSRESDSRPTLAAEIVVAAAAFLVMCLVVFLRSPQLMEPDDYAYRASIIALSQGHVLLTNSQYIALKAQLSAHGGPGIEQWVRLKSGKWISQKNPGYPFFAVIFQWIHALRAAPLFYGAIGCGGLFYGARNWLGRWGGVYAVALYCFSGAALIFAWRSTMPTFTDASLVAGAAGVLLGVLLARDDQPRKRFLLGALAFLALDAATLIRYTDVVVLAVAIIALAALSRTCRVRGATLLGWFATVVIFGAVDLVVNHFLYGGVFTTGYRTGLVTFRASAVVPNLERMPIRLIESMPMAILALASLVWIAIRVSNNRSGAQSSTRAHCDAVVALVLGFGWFSVWAFYSAYTWTVGQTIVPGNPIHVVRFYVPVVGLIALLAAWFLKRIPGWASATLLAIIVAAAFWSYVTPSNDIVVSSASAHAPSASMMRPMSPALVNEHESTYSATNEAKNQRLGGHQPAELGNDSIMLLRVTEVKHVHAIERDFLHPSESVSLQI
jgi:hypothetical protein